MRKEQSGRIVETPLEARQAELGPSVLTLLSVSLGTSSRDPDRRLDDFFSKRSHKRPRQSRLHTTATFERSDISGTITAPGTWLTPRSLETSMKRPSIFVCFALLAAAPAFAQNPPAQPGPNNNAVNSAGQNNSERACCRPQQLHRRTGPIEDRRRRLHQRHRVEEGRQWRLARRGEQGRLCHSGQRRFPRQRQQRQVRKNST